VTHGLQAGRQLVPSIICVQSGDETGTASYFSFIPLCVCLSELCENTHILKTRLLNPAEHEQERRAACRAPPECMTCSLFSFTPLFSSYQKSCFLCASLFFLCFLIWEDRRLGRDRGSDDASIQTSFRKTKQILNSLSLNCRSCLLRGTVEGNGIQKVPNESVE